METFCVVSTAFNFAPQTATNRLRGLCFVTSGYECELFIRATQGGISHTFRILKIL